MASKPSASARLANSIALLAGGMMRPGAPSVTRMSTATFALWASASSSPRCRPPCYRPTIRLGSRYAVTTRGEETVVPDASVSVLTGGAGGIALACARRLAAHGPILLGDLDLDRLDT